MLNQVLDHLAALVACDTQNPPRRIAADSPLFATLRSRLPAGVGIEIVDHGEGRVSLLARRGEPRRLFNFHVDTVPAVPSWSADPLRLRVEGGRAIGLGACDTKGAAACMLAAAHAAPPTAPLALLFTSDEEAGSSCCVKTFLAQSARPLPYDEVIVAEPTGARAVVGHRGLGAAIGRFRGVAGHGSAERALVDSAVHEAVRWASRALALAEAEEERGVGGLRGIRLNLGVLHGGKKSNVIADEAEVRFGCRARPGEDPAALIDKIAGCSSDPSRVTWETSFLGPPLPAPGGTVERSVALAAALGIAVAPPVDFWSEAALFAAAGATTLVFGAGDIAQAHSADEWVALDQLAAVAAAYSRWLAPT